MNSPAAKLPLLKKRLRTLLQEDWPNNVQSAGKEQEELRNRVCLENRLGEIRYALGLDCGYRTQHKKMVAAACLLRFPELTVAQGEVAMHDVPITYIPGYLSFREIPAILKVMEKLEIYPDLVVCDGQGIAHPKRLGLASHLGVLLDIPTIGVAKSRLTGTHEEPGLKRGEYTALRDKGEIIGMVVRTRTGVKPVYVSPGHLVDMDTSVDLTFKLSPKYRLPETTRCSHSLASRAGENPTDGQSRPDAQ